MEEKFEILNKMLEQFEGLIKANIYTHKEILNFKEAVIYLGISESQLYKLTSKNIISYSKPEGKIIFFSRKDLDQWALKNRIKSSKEIEEMAKRHMCNKSSNN
jgi:excisionase family DNA binding protein